MLWQARRLGDAMIATAARSLFIAFPAWILMGTLVYADGQIPLSADMLINLSGQAPVVELIDEQDLGKESDPTKRIHAKSFLSGSWQNKDLYFPKSIDIDLGSEHEFSQMAYFDGQGNGNLAVSFLSKSEWKPIFQNDLNKYLQWVTNEMSVKTRYLQLTFDTPPSAVGGNPFF